MSLKNKAQSVKKNSISVYHSAPFSWIFPSLDKSKDVSVRNTMDKINCGPYSESRHYACIYAEKISYIQSQLVHSVLIVYIIKITCVWVTPLRLQDFFLE